MAKRKAKVECCDPSDDMMCCCNVESIVTIDDRGQILIPKDIRKRAGVKAGDKLALVTWKMRGQIGCIALIRTEELAGMVKSFLGPMMKDLGEE